LKQERTQQLVPHIRFHARMVTETVFEAYSWQHCLTVHKENEAIMKTSHVPDQCVSASTVASAFLDCRNMVLEQWTSRVTAEIPTASRLGEPILTDALPALYDNIAEALAAGAPRLLGTSGSTLGIAHGRERANMTEYGPHDLIHELQIFRDVMFSVARSKRLALSEHDAEVIGRSIEAAARESICGYSMADKEDSEAFISSLSHDLRNPLSVANATAQLIQLKATDPGIVGLANRVCKKIAETDAMIQTLLDAAVLKGRMKLKLHIALFDIMPLVEEVCADLPLLGQQVKVEGEPISGYWCRASMKRVLENLLSNAQKYGDPSHPITVRISRVDGRMLLSIHNEGRPIEKAEMERLFKSFHRIEDVDVRGWGLGLPYVQNVAECHGGSVIADSGEGRGTTFTLSLPVDTRPYIKH
jgi:signal transduction histidine kinase